MDIFNIDLIDKKYDFVYLPATTICILLEDRKKVIKLFDDISDILKPNGRFCFDIRLYDKFVFCKTFLHKIAKTFCRSLQLHFVGNCKPGWQSWYLPAI